MTRAKPEVLEGPYTVLIKDRLRATEKSDPNKWSIWTEIWRCRSFEDLARACPNPVKTCSTDREITWRTEARWALENGWIKKIPERRTGVNRRKVERRASSEAP